MIAMVASHNLNVNNNWYLDSSATNHLTNDFNNLTIGSEYGGGSQVYEANRSSLSILRYGSTSFAFSKPDKPLVLNNLLHIPSITKNLISVSQFTRHNHVFFKFHPNFCYVKDQVTSHVLLQGLFMKDFIILTLHLFMSLLNVLLITINFDL